MRRTFASLAVAGLGVGLFGALPAQAQVSPVNVIVTEGVGRVCGAAELNTLAERNAYGNVKPGTLPGTKHAWCIYPSTAGYDAPVNYGTTTHPQWWVPGYKDGSKFQGLFLPGIGPGANGPYSLQITSGLNPPSNVCIDTIEGSGCSTRLVGRLTPAPLNGFGAHAGSSQGTGTYVYSSTTGLYKGVGKLGWENSASTILPLTGEVTGGTNPGQSLIGFASSRGVTGDNSAGNAGVQQPTTGFQTEGILIVY